jgi:NADPH:quinone reductase-like Zn-dependent oxidoreductase
VRPPTQSCPHTRGIGPSGGGRRSAELRHRVSDAASIWFRNDLVTLLDLLKQGKLKPLIAHRFPLNEARRAHEILGEGGVLGKIVLEPNG